MSCKLWLITIMAMSAAAEQLACEANSDADQVVMMQKMDPDVTMAPADVVAEIQGADENAMEKMVAKEAEQKMVAEKSSTGADQSSTGPSFKAILAEYVAMTLFVILGCGSAMGAAKEPGWVLQVALSFGLAITSLAYSVGAYSGGHINCAVTLGLVLYGQVSILQGICNFIAQMLGSVTGAWILTQMVPQKSDKTGGIGSNSVGEGYTQINAFVGEAAMTFLLMFVVLETAVNPLSEANRTLACVAIGFAVFLAHSVLIPIDGCSINPTRSFGPALVSKISYQSSEAFKDMWVFWAGPLAGAAMAVGVSKVLAA